MDTHSEKIMNICEGINRKYSGVTIISHHRRLSICCNAPIIGEIDNDGVGRCGKCKDMSGTYKSE